MGIRKRRIELKMPLLGPEESLIEVVEWLLPAGAAVEIDQDLLELTIDGTPFTFPSPLDGILISTDVEPGDAIETGQVLAVIETQP